MRMHNTSGDGGDGGDGLNITSETQHGVHRHECLVGVTSSRDNSVHLYRDPDSKRAIRKDKNRAAAPAIPRARSPTVATTSRRSSIRPC